MSLVALPLDRRVRGGHRGVGGGGCAPWGRAGWRPGRGVGTPDDGRGRTLRAVGRHRPVPGHGGRRGVAASRVPHRRGRLPGSRRGWTELVPRRASEAPRVLDSVRAARSLVAGSGPSTPLWGHLQGGQAVLFAGQLAGSYAPALRVRAAAVAAPATELGTLLNDDLGGHLGGDDRLIRVRRILVGPCVALSRAVAVDDPPAGRRGGHAPHGGPVLVRADADDSRACAAADRRLSVGRPLDYPAVVGAVG